MASPGRLATPQSLKAIIGGFVDPKRTVYRGITMRSRLEAAFARYLDDQGVPWTYEPAIYGPPGSGYLPDFRVARPDGPHFYEIKPTLREVPKARERMAIIWATHSDATLVVVCAQASRWFACQPGGGWTTWVERWRHA